MLRLDFSLSKGEGGFGCAKAFKIVHGTILVALAYDRNAVQ
jgi:hypothetical protein